MRTIPEQGSWFAKCCAYLRTLGHLSKGVSAGNQPSWQPDTYLASSFRRITVITWTQMHRLDPHCWEKAVGTDSLHFNRLKVVPVLFLFCSESGIQVEELESQTFVCPVSLAACYCVHCVTLFPAPILWSAIPGKSAWAQHRLSPGLPPINNTMIQFVCLFW